MADMTTGTGGAELTLSMVQNLIKEVRQLREENVKLFQEMTKQNQAIFNLLGAVRNNVIGSDFLSCIHQTIHNNSANFLVKNMIPTAKMFPNRMENLKYALSQIELDGLYLEFGVFKGESINLISSVETDEIIYGFDSFEGLPEAWTAREPKGTFDVGGNLPQVNENVRLIKGWFDDTLPKFVEEHSENCAFIHVDSDLYSSAKTVFSFLNNRIVSGTVIVFDEYINYLGWEKGEHKAFNEFLEETNLSCDYISHSYNQVTVKIK